MNPNLTCAVVCLVTSILAIPVHARIIHVPGESSSIRSGISDAVDGDTVMVSPGVYDEWNLNFSGKKITVMSTDPRDPHIVLTTIINANSQGRLFNFELHEDSTSVLTGFTLRNGYSTDSWGGAIRCVNASPKISYNIIRDNVTEYGGAGVFLEGSNAIIRGNTIMNNSAVWGGGGIRCSNADPEIAWNRIYNNSSAYGGGIDCHYGADPVIANNIIIGNSAGDGGGVYCYDYSSPVLIYNVIALNNAEYGGGMHCRYDTHPVLINNSFVGNTASLQGGAVRCMFSAPIDVINSIFWGNQAITGKEFYMGGYPSADPTKLTISYSDVEGGLGSVYHEEGNDIEWGDGMIDADPLFVFPDRDDYRLLWGSPCIDSGHPDSLDFDDTRREIGARIFNQNQFLTLYLSPSTTSIGQGGDLEVAYTLINRWDEPVTFSLVSEVMLPSGNVYGLLERDNIVIPGNYTAQVPIFHDVPIIAPEGAYLYRSKTLIPVSAVVGEDRFVFEVD